jgi:GDPmannose 4,6-dehydratase
MNKLAFIIGITGQDGSYLAELLLEKGYTVYGMIRRSSSINTGRIDHIFNKLKLRYGDITDMGSIIKILTECISELKEGYLEIYNLAAQSHVAISFDLEKYTADVDATGVLNLLQSIRLLNLTDKVRLYQASTSELYGNTLNTNNLKYLDEESPMNPVSPYAIAKLYAYHMIRYYRKAYNMFCVNGILFNHTSPRRGHNFVCKKICDYVRNYKEYRISVNIVKNNDQDILIENPEPIQALQLGNLNATRDFGHSKDYVKGMWMILQNEKPVDYVLATKHRVTVREFVNIAFKEAGFGPINWVGEGVNEKGYLKGQTTPIVEVNKKYFRPYDLTDLIGNSKKVKDDLGWTEEYSLQDIIKEMITLTH